MAHERFDHTGVEEAARAKWALLEPYRTNDVGTEKTYVLDMFPYPSGEGLHVGHPKGYIATDIYSRHNRMKGKSVLHPMGWDAFGLPAENYALKNKVHPREAVERNVARFKEQLAGIGFDYDWTREINTTDPAYYRWTQWIFLKLYEQGLAFQSNEPINWCPSCLTGLANEDLDGTVCERCGTEVEKKSLPQWVLKITAYADRMLADLDTLNWPEHIKEAQRNWIGRSEGAEIDFLLNFKRNPEANNNRGPNGERAQITVFTTRPDTIYGATYLVLAPDHLWVTLVTDENHDVLENKEEVKAYVEVARKKTERERIENREKTGVRIEGVVAMNPATREEIPIYVADYVLATYGTGAIMAVPAHDERDFEFAQNFNLPIRHVIASPDDAVSAEDGSLINSGTFTGRHNREVFDEITESIGGRKSVTYKIQDWVFSRQRYWGEPIPIIHCGEHGAVPVPYEQLPVLLPDVDHYEPTGTGESPLAAIDAWVNVPCPTCGKLSKRETNTMPQWAGSSWYYLRYMDPNNDTELVSKAKEKAWGPVDVYVGGDHAVRHLIYARFWHKFLYDMGVVSTIEPFARLEFLGFILAEDGRKMSKRYGNVINPDDVVKEYGADAFRVYEMFMGPFENTTAWSTTSIAGTSRFIERVWNAQQLVTESTSPALTSLLHKTIRKVEDDIEAFKFNTAVSHMMIFMNALEEEKSIGRKEWSAFIRILAPFAPHITDVLWEKLGEEGTIHRAPWPAVDPALLVSSTVSVIVQINGKKRGEVELSPDATQEEALAATATLPAIADVLSQGTPERVVYVPGRIINIVLSST